MSRKLWVGAARARATRQPAQALTSLHLTANERRILEFRASGLDRNEIARLLHRSPQTISNALTIAKEKLGARSLIQAAMLLTQYTQARVLVPSLLLIGSLPYPLVDWSC